MQLCVRLTGIGLFVLLLAAAAAYAASGTKVEPVSTNDVTALRAETEGFFEERSQEEARAMFTNVNDQRSMIDQHAAAHMFGEVVYEKFGLKGFAICDSEFGFGCYHSFIAFAFDEHGQGVLHSFDASCVDAYGEKGLGCFHGIGHGVLSYRGYSIEDLNAALEGCATLSWQGAYGGCQDGVFMEYNLRTMAATEADRNHPFVYSERFSPCTSVAPRFRPACYFNLPQWWIVPGTGASGHEKDAGKYCAEVGNAESMKACFRGIGYAVVPQLGFDVDQSIRACDSSTNKPEHKVLCREGVAWGYSASDLKEYQLKICSEGLTEEQSATCNAEYLFTIQ